MLIGVCVAAFVAFIIFQQVTAEKEDLRVMIVAAEQGSQLYEKQDAIKSALEKYCPDFDGNGKIVVSVVFVDFTANESSGEYYLVQTQRFSNEINFGEAQMILTDEGFGAFVYGENSLKQQDYLDFSGELPEDSLYENCGVRMRYTELAESAGWADCPENVFILVREEINADSKDAEKRARQREKALAVLQNILDGNVIN